MKALQTVPVYSRKMARLTGEFGEHRKKPHELKDEIRRRLGRLSMKFRELNKGETVAFGGYDWRVLDVQSDRALLIAKDIAEKRAYNTKNEVTTWEKCTLRAYLNGDFYNKFSDDEKQLILETKVFNNDNPEYGTGGGNTTTDKIFLLSINEANKYFPNNSERITFYQASARWWWLRSPGISNHAAFVYSDGFVNVHGYRVDYAYSGVRPALYLKIR